MDSYLATIVIFARPILKLFQSYFSNGKDANVIGKESKESARRECKSTKENNEGSSCSCSTPNVFDFSNEMDWNDVVGKDTYTLVKFTAKWCKPCKRMEPTFLNLSTLHSQVSFVSVDVDLYPNIAVDSGATLIPHFQLYKGGKIVGKCVGESQEKLYDLMKNCS